MNAPRWMREMLRGTSAQERHVESDVTAGVHDAATFAERFALTPMPPATQYEMQRDRVAITKTSTRDELVRDVGAKRRASDLPRFGRLKSVAGCVVFGAAEVVTLGGTLKALGQPPQEAYTSAFITAVTAVGLIEGATGARSRIVRALCYVGLTVVMLGTAWIRSRSFFEAETGIGAVVSGVIALTGALGAGIALHHYRRRAHAAAAIERQISVLEREARATSRDVTTAEKRTIKHERQAAARSAELASLRQSYDRLHKIEVARQARRSDRAEELPSS